MKAILLAMGLVSIIGYTRSQEINENCNLINIGTTDGGSDVISNGVIQKYFDQRITDKFDLYYIPYERSEQSFYAKTPVPLADRPNAQKTDRNLNAYLEMYQENSEDANSLKIKMEIKYECPQNSYGIPVLNLTLQFEGCPTYVIAWQKSCGNDVTPPMNALVIQENNSLLKRPFLFQDGQLKEQDIIVDDDMDQMYLKIEVINNAVYYLDPPYFKNLYQAMSIMYPVLKSNAAFGGEISNRSIKHLLIEFNCLGIKGTQDVTVVIPPKDGYYQPIEINFRKQCHHKSIFGVLKEDMSESVWFDIEMILFIFFILGNFVCCYIGFMRVKGTNEYFESTFEMLRRFEHQAKKTLSKGKRYFKNISLPSLSKMRDPQSSASKNSSASSSGNNDKAFTSAFGQEIEIDMTASGSNSSANSSNTYGGV